MENSIQFAAVNDKQKSSFFAVKWSNFTPMYVKKNSSFYSFFLCNESFKLELLYVHVYAVTLSTVLERLFNILATLLIFGVSLPPGGGGSTRNSPRPLKCMYSI